MSRDPTFFFVIPCFNEQDNVGATIGSGARQNDYAHRGDAACNWQLLCCWAENGPLVMSKPVTLMPTTIAIGYLRRLA
jgi:hypothetical protein